jgi:hypothetical protein
MEAKIRRERETLFMSSLAVILFFVWGSAKVLFSYIMDPVTWLQYVSGSDDPAITQGKTTAIIAAYILVNLIFRLCIGLPAIKECRQNSSGKRFVYIIHAVICLVMDVLTFRSAVILPIESGEYTTIIGPLAMIVIEITSCYAIVQLIISSLKLKYLRHKAKTA